MRALSRTVLLLTLLSLPRAAAEERAASFRRADDEGSSSSRHALGFQLDLFPTVVSAVNGKLGYAPQVWLGVESVRLRLVTAHLEPPDAVAFADEGFKNPSTTVVATMVDYTFGKHFDGFWVCAGIEQWWRTIEHQDVTAPARWSSTIATSGVGYTWRFTEFFYVDPWAGVHWTMSPETVRVGPYEYEPPRLVGNGSVKIGAMFDL